MMTDKKAIRKEISALKRALSHDEIDRFSQELADRFLALDEYKHASSLYAYLPYNQEVDTLRILRHAIADGKHIAVPKVYGDTMRFIRLDDLSKVISGFHGIPEPEADAPEANDAHAPILIPGLAFDPAGHRIGYGGGYYDRYLKTHPGHLCVALCYPFQLYEQLDVEKHDVPVNLILCAGKEQQV